MASISAAGTTQGTATPTGSDVFQEVIAATAGVDDGILLDRGQGTFWRGEIVRNSTGDTVQVYPESGDAIDDLGVDAPFELEAGETMFFVYLPSGSQWYALTKLQSLQVSDLPPGAGSGTVTSVALAVPSWQSVAGSPITTSGTITVSDNDQSANEIFAGPSSGPDAAPAFRALVATDIPAAPFVATASATVANTASETTLLGAGAGSLTLAANSFTAGSSLIVEAWGYLSTAAAVPTLRLRFKLGSTVILDTTVKRLMLVGALTDALWRFRGRIVCRTTGATGTVFAQGEFSYKEPITGRWHTFECVSTSATTVDTTGTLAADLMATWGTASASNTITCSNFSMEV